MSHPPILPNCEITMSCDGFPTIQLISGTRIRNKRIIAAVARCAWLDKARSIDVSKWEHRDANDNAELWRLWGENK